MPELPEILVLSRQMRLEVVGKEVAYVDVLQPKNLNMPVEEFVKTIVGRRIVSVEAKGKWLILKLSGEYFLLMNLGMGGDLLHFRPDDALPESYKFMLRFSDGSGFTINFWWFGYIHLVDGEGLKKHKMVGEIGLSPLEAESSLEHLRVLLKGRKGNVKAFLIDQRNIAGIGNVSAQDILFKARLHPNRKINTLTEREVQDLYASIKEVLAKSVDKGGLAYERDFYGKKGGFTGDDFLVGYKEGKPCPACSTIIEKIKTGSTSTYICPKCQKVSVG